jgi:cytochrome c biogenesis protein CcdA
MSLLLALLGGLLTSLSPCVIPLLPVVVGSATARHRLGPVALCAGLIFSFSVIAVVVAIAIEAYSFNPGTIRIVGALLLLLFGVTSVFPALQEFNARLLAPMASRAGAAAAKSDQAGLTSNFFVGLLLGAIWSPCAGPTLGSAIGLATQAGTLFQGLVLILAFGIGASLPLLAVAYGSRSLFQSNKRWLVVMSGKARLVFGVMIILLAVSILSGWDKKLEAAVLRQTPDSWVDFVTRY